MVMCTRLSFQASAASLGLTAAVLRYRVPVYLCQFYIADLLQHNNYYSEVPLY